jgi:hypothetical protein
VRVANEASAAVYLDLNSDTMARGRFDSDSREWLVAITGVAGPFSSKVTEPLAGVRGAIGPSAHQAPASRAADSTGNDTSPARGAPLTNDTAGA